MQCPNCNFETEVLKTEPFSKARRRLRQCDNCKITFWTVETVIESTLTEPMEEEVLRIIFPEHRKKELQKSKK